MMGLDVSHDAWHGAYSAFNRFRTKICQVAGLGNLEDWEGFGGTKKWPSVEKEPLVALLYHSDCDGEIPPEECVGIARRLRELAPNIPDEDGGGYIRNWRGSVLQFAEGCEAAAAANEPLEFM